MREQMTVDEFHGALKAQGVSSHEHCAFICPACGTVQSGRDLIAAGAGDTFDDVERYLAFACVGRFTDAGPALGKKTGKGCDWSLGGLFSIHELEITTPDGKTHPRFRLATPAEAQAHEQRHKEPTP